MFDKWPDFHPREVGFKEQRELFDKLWKSSGEPPPVIDSDDLLAEPHAIIKRWCESVGIPFIEEALSWEPGARDEVSWWDGGSFHANLRNSSGLKPQVRQYKEIGDVPDRVGAVYTECLEHYQYLFGHRIKL